MVVLYYHTAICKVGYKIKITRIIMKKLLSVIAIGCILLLTAPGCESDDTEIPEIPNKEENGGGDNTGGEDPENPGGEDPDNPGEEDPENPGGENPENPGGEDPENPGGEDPDNPGGEDPENPGGEMSKYDYDIKSSGYSFYYYNDLAKNGVHNYHLVINTDIVSSTDEIDGKINIQLDIYSNVSPTSPYHIPPGEYVFDTNNTFVAGTFSQLYSNCQIHGTKTGEDARNGLVEGYLMVSSYDSFEGWFKTTSGETIHFKNDGYNSNAYYFVPSEEYEPTNLNTEVAKLSICNTPNAAANGLHRYTFALSNKGATITDDDTIKMITEDDVYLLHIYSSQLCTAENSLPTGVYKFSTLNTSSETLDGATSWYINTYDNTKINRFIDGVVTVTETGIEATLYFRNGAVHHIIYEGSVANPTPTSASYQSEMPYWVKVDKKLW